MEAERPVDVRVLEGGIVLDVLGAKVLIKVLHALPHVDLLFVDVFLHVRKGVGQLGPTEVV